MHYETLAVQNLINDPLAIESIEQGLPYFFALEEGSVGIVEIQEDQGVARETC
jgi:hypothetical protein